MTVENVSAPPLGNIRTDDAQYGTADRTASAQGLSSDFETFLKMLTAQARYQDPLEPIDSTEYAAQLAQFSMVEQQVQTNEKLASLVAQLGSANMATLSGWIGQEVRSQGAALFDGSPITLAYSPAKGADQVALVVSDDEGREVQRLPLPLSGGEVKWSGMDEKGVPLPAGTYSFDILSMTRGETIGRTPASFYGGVAEVQLREGKTVLILDSGQEILAASVDAIRRPPA